MFGTIRKHQTWLWVLISVAVIISFVVYFTPTVGSGGGGDSVRTQYGTINGDPISRKQYSEAVAETRLGLFLRSGGRAFPDRGDLERAGISLETEVRNRLVLLDRIKALDVRVGVDEIASWITENLGDPNQPGSARRFYDTLVSTVLPQNGVYEADFQRFIKHQIAIGHLLSVAGIPGRLIAPREAASQFKQENEKFDTRVVLFSASNHLDSVTVDPVALSQYYTNNQSLYRVPERVQVHYVEFVSSNYVAEAEAAMARNTNLSQQIDQAYLSGNAGSFVDTNGQVMPPDAAKAQLKERMRQQQSLVAARRAAANFATNLESMTPPKAENLVNLAAAKGILAGVTEPFGEMQWPTNVNASSRFVETAFRLNAEMPISLPIVSGESVYLLALKDRVPSVIPPLDAVLPRVTEDFRREQATRLAREAGGTFVRLLTNGLSTGTTFEAICTQAGVSPIPVPQFSPATRTLPGLDRSISFDQLKMSVGSKQAGQATDLVFTRDGGLVAYVNARVPVTDAELAVGLPKYLEDRRNNEQMQAFNEWFRRQVELTGIDTLKGRDESPEPAP